MKLFSIQQTTELIYQTQKIRFNSETMAHVIYHFLFISLSHLTRLMSKRNDIVTVS